MFKIMLTAIERRKYYVIHNTLLKYTTNSKAASILRLSVRQIKRLKRRVEQFGANGVVHCLKGKPSNHQKK